MTLALSERACLSPAQEALKGTQSKFAK